jgi:hypothetical protein
VPLKADQTRRKTVVMEPDEDAKKGRASVRWWLLDKEKIHEGVFGVCEDILTNLAVRRRMNYFFAALYNDTGAAFMASRNANLYYNRTALDGNAMLNSSMSLNVLQNCIDTATAMIAKNKPKPEFLPGTKDPTDDFSLKVRGKKLTKYVEGVFDQTKLYHCAQRVFTDACIYGTGALKLFIDDNKICAENLFIEEILVDDLEGMHECPQQLHQRKFRRRDEVLAMFPKHKDAIMKAESIAGGTSTFSTADIVCVIESWHLPSAPKGKDGQHVISISNCTLLVQDYRRDYYPIFFFRWAHQTLGFWGRGICHEIWKLQRELDVCLQVIQRSQRLLGGPVICVEAGSNISEDHITSNKLAKVIEYANQKPDWLTPPCVQAELYEHVQYLEDRMYKVTGISQMQAQGTKDPTIKSAVGQREAADQAAGRFEIVGQRWEAFFMDIARAIVDFSSDIEDPSTIVRTRDGGKFLSFKDAQVDMEYCRLSVFPVSGLPSTPAGKLDQLMEWAQAGYVSKEQVMDVVDIPDLEDVTSLETAAMRRAQEQLSQIKEEGKYTPPGLYLNHAMAYRFALLEVDRSESQGVKPERVDMLRRWADEVKVLIDAAQAKQTQEQGMQNQVQMGTAAQAGQQQQAQQPMAPQEAG